ncbi:hypothetical protein MTO96_041576 [Rhipicephalus appendiculatus]
MRTAPSSSSSPSPPPKRNGAACRELCFDIEYAPSRTPQGYLVFVDSCPEREEEHQKGVIVPPAGVLQPCPLSSDVTRPFDSHPICSGSLPGYFNVMASSGTICRICHKGAGGLARRPERCRRAPGRWWTS